MNKKYICFGAFAFVEDQNDKLVTRKYENNFGQVLAQENVIEVLNEIIDEDINDRKKLARKIKYLKYFSGKSAWSLYIIIALCFFLLNGLISSVVVLGIAKVMTVLQKIIIKRYNKKLKCINYRLTKSAKQLEEEQEQMEEIKKIESETPYNEYIKIEDDEKLYRIERNLYLAYLYKLREDIIQKKIQEDDIENYLDDIQINDEYLDNIDKKVILSYAKEKNY